MHANSIWASLHLPFYTQPPPFLVVHFAPGKYSSHAVSVFNDVSAVSHFLSLHLSFTQTQLSPELLNLQASTI